MKIILSRKGFDSVYGGVASPIFSDDAMVSIPIPVGDPAESDPMIGRLEFNDVNLGELMAGLGASKKNGKQRAKLTSESPIHRDPDIYPEFSNAGCEWKAAFGQAGRAQTHLAKQNVGKGDLFLFFGWFRHVQRVGNGYKYQPDAPDIHTVFGWLQVGEVVHLNDSARQAYPERRKRLIKRYPYLQQHPHVASPNPPYGNNTLYVASDRLEVPGQHCANLSGAGAFRHFHRRLQLTDPDGNSRKYWKLPAWFYPKDMRHALTYHGDPDRWQERNGCAILKSVDIGQEFVLDTEYYPEAREWVVDLIRKAMAESRHETNLPL